MKLLFTSLIILIVSGGLRCTKELMGRRSMKEDIEVIVSTFAGTGAASFNNGSLSAAQFHYPQDIIVARDGTLYITDDLNQRIRMIRNGKVSTFAGSGLFGIYDGNSTDAQFKNPFSITIDGAGNLYTTDENDPRIRRITPGGTVSLMAGLGLEGYTNGRADTARFKSGSSIVADGAGNIFVSDALNNVIRKVSIDGKVTTIAGTGISGFKEGKADQAQFDYPGAIALDKAGNLYVADRGNFRIRKITPDGIVTTFAGSGFPGVTDSSALDAAFSGELRDLAFDSKGNLFVIDYNKIRKISAAGIVTTVAGSTEGCNNGDGSVAKFNYPAGIAVDAGDNLYVADLNNHCIRKITFR